MTPALPLEWFGQSSAPVEIDFGCHRGAFLLGMAALHPGVNFLGIEKQVDRVEKCNARAERLGFANARAIQGVGAESLKGLPAASVLVFHLYFPDPWPKRRHASRRVFQKNFLAEIRRVLRADGVLRLMTDNEPYFTEMCELTREGWKEIPWEDGRETVQTAFEITFRKLGQTPFRAALVPSG
ncbi:MAG: tRNA (guanosine(46)-N7)-methyltransferase TrmB [Spartobacteria bacterium]